MTVNRAKTSEYEAYIVTICFRNEARDKLKAITKAENVFASTRLVASEAVHPKLWEKVALIKSQGKKQT